MSFSVHDFITEENIRKSLNITDDRVRIDIDWDGSRFRDTWCDTIERTPAAVHVHYVRRAADDDGVYWVEASYSWQAARNAVDAIVNDPDVSDDTIVTVTVNAHALVYANVELQVAA